MPPPMQVKGLLQLAEQLISESNYSDGGSGGGSGGGGGLPPLPSIHTGDGESCMGCG